ncbi:MAG TPA: nuclear transport factor 2 family protein [Planctomycetota bacterium]|nr:nuclear transport factor 2 family protein [Planctomycetota bacterium]
MTKRVRGFVLATALVFISARAAEDAELAAIKAADDERVAATLAADKARLEAIFSDELRYAHSTGNVDTKASYVEALSGGKLKYLAIEYKERNFTVPERHIALMTARVRMKTTSAATGESDNLFSVLAVWREEKGKWRFLAWQSCKLPAGQ